MSWILFSLAIKLLKERATNVLFFFVSLCSLMYHAEDFINDPEQYILWRLEHLVNFGLGGERID